MSSKAESEGLQGVGLLRQLVFPTAETPTISASRVHTSDARVATFGEDCWPLFALDNDVTRTRRNVNFADWPDGFRDFAKHVTYALINYGNPPALVEREHVAYVAWPSPGSINKLLGILRAHVLWLTGEWSALHPDTAVTEPHDLDSGHLDDLRRWIDSRQQDSRTQADRLEIAVRVWHLNPWLPVAAQWPEPTWRHNNLASRRTRGDNKAKRLSQEAIGPLLEWAIAFVTQFSDEILSAHKHYQDRLAGIRPYLGSSPMCRDVLAEYETNGRPLPAAPAVGSGKRDGQVGWQTLAYRHQLPAGAFARAFQRRGEASTLVIDLDPSSTALDLPVSAEFHGRPWIPYVSAYDVHETAARGKGQPGQLIAHLRTACVIVSGYLTGARPEEILGWEHGAAPDPLLGPGGSRLHLIHGRVWKGVQRQDDGTPGVPKEAVWATIAPATTAIHVAEAISALHGHTSGLLFTGTGRGIATANVSTWISDFANFVNVRLAPHTVNPGAFTIPIDADGLVTLRRFRRTLAWFIRNRPGGEVTVAIQYDHLDEILASAYAGTKESGMNNLLLEEDWAHRERTVRHLADLLDSGQGVSGPAASRAIAATQSLPRLVTPGDERRMRKDPSLVIYDNPSAVALCLYDERSALCRKIQQSDKASRPNLLGCVDGCKCCARTDSQLLELRDQARELRDHAVLAPRPLAQSLLAEADRRDATVQRFESTRMSLSPDADLNPPEGVQ